MEEKKKRWRPSLTAYRALEKELTELKEAFQKLVKHSAESDADRVRLLGEQKSDDEVNELRVKNDTLEKSNKCMEDELKRLRSANNALLTDFARVRNELNMLRSRGLLKRIFNK